MGLVLDGVLDMGSEFQDFVRLGSNIRFEVNLNQAGCLLLLDKGTTGRIYCLCPSRYAPESHLPAGLTVLPQDKSPHKSFKITENPGLEQLVAVIVKDKLPLEWLPEGIKAPLQLNEDHLKTLLEYLAHCLNCQILYAEFTVTA